MIHFKVVPLGAFLYLGYMILVPVALGVIAFTSAGITAGSCAAGMQFLMEEEQQVGVLQSSGKRYD